MNKFRILSVLIVLAMVFSFANVSLAGAATTAVTLQEGTATYSQELYCCNLNVDEAVDGHLYDYGASGTYNGWAIYTGSSDPQTAVWETASDVDASQLVLQRKVRAEPGELSEFCLAMRAISDIIAFLVIADSFQSCLNIKDRHW